jgi:rhomboid family GlyGly-CTERM serine protease
MGGALRGFTESAMSQPSPRFPIVTLLLSAAALAAWLIRGAAAGLQYDRSALAAGQWWRIFTCHWTHFSLDHLLWDVGMFAILGVICERRSRAALIACIGLSAVMISALAWVLMPQIQTYRGLSGIDSALFSLLAFDLLRQQFRIGARPGVVVAIAGLLVLFIGKIVVEIVFGRTVFVGSSAARMVPAPQAHLAGIVAGLVCAGSMFASRGVRSHR